MRKATSVLERMFGAGQALVTVDVVLNHQQTRVTTEEVLAATQAHGDQAPTGVVVKERTSTRQGSAGESGAPGSGRLTSQDIDYQTGKRVMQVVSPSGTVSRLNVAVVIKRALSDAEVQRVRELVSATVGVQTARGDVIALYAMSPSRLDVHAVTGAVAPAASGTADASMPSQGAEREVSQETTAARQWWALMAAGVLAACSSGWVWLSTRRTLPSAPKARSLTQSERDALLTSVQQWLGTSEDRA